MDGASTMRAAVFHGVNDLRLEDVAIPIPGPGEAVVRVTMTTICGTDVHILKGEYPVRPGLVVGHEPVGVIEELGPGVVHSFEGRSTRFDLYAPSAVTAAPRAR